MRNGAIDLPPHPTYTCNAQPTLVRRTSVVDLVLQPLAGDGLITSPRAKNTGQNSDASTDGPSSGRRPHRQARVTVPRHSDEVLKMDEARPVSASIVHAGSAIACGRRPSRRRFLDRMGQTTAELTRPWGRASMQRSYWCRYSLGSNVVISGTSESCQNPHTPDSYRVDARSA